MNTKDSRLRGEMPQPIALHADPTLAAVGVLQDLGAVVVARCPDPACAVCSGPLHVAA